MLATVGEEAAGARQLTQAIVTLTQAALLLRGAPEAVATSFCATRLAESPYGGGVFGALPLGRASGAVIDRALPG